MYSSRCNQHPKNMFVSLCLHMLVAETQDLLSVLCRPVGQGVGSSDWGFRLDQNFGGPWMCLQLGRENGEWDIIDAFGLQKQQSDLWLDHGLFMAIYVLFDRSNDDMPSGCVGYPISKAIMVDSSRTCHGKPSCFILWSKPKSFWHFWPKNVGKLWRTYTENDISYISLERFRFWLPQPHNLFLCLGLLWVSPKTRTLCPKIQWIQKWYPVLIGDKWGVIRSQYVSQYMSNIYI